MLFFFLIPASLAWLGLNDYRSSLTYEWTSQSRVTYTNWGTHQPVVNSGILYHSVAIAQVGEILKNVFILDNYFAIVFLQTLSSLPTLMKTDQVVMGY